MSSHDLLVAAIDELSDEHLAYKAATIQLLLTLGDEHRAQHEQLLTKMRAMLKVSPEELDEARARLVKLCPNPLND